MVLVFSEMELRTSGKCPSELNETECKKGPYPKSSYKWSHDNYNTIHPTGCYVTLSKLSVYFNSEVNGTDCTSERNCLCKKGKWQFYLFICLKVKFYIILH